MKKTEIEYVLTLGLDYLKPNLREKISDVDLHVTCKRIWHDLKHRDCTERDLIETYGIYRLDIDNILKEGSSEIRRSDGSEIRLILLEKDNVKTEGLENGDILMWYDGDEK